MAQNRGRARHRHRASFPADATFHLLEIGIQAIQLSPYHAGPATRRLQRLSTAAASMACCGPLHLSDPGKPSDPRTSLRVPPGYAGDATGRLEAQCGRSSLTPPARRREPGSGEEDPEERSGPARRHHAKSRRVTLPRPLDTNGPYGCRRSGVCWPCPPLVAGVAYGPARIVDYMSPDASSRRLPLTLVLLCASTRVFGLLGYCPSCGPGSGR